MLSHTERPPYTGGRYGGKKGDLPQGGYMTHIARAGLNTTMLQEELRLEGTRLRL